MNYLPLAFAASLFAAPAVAEAQSVPFCGFPTEAASSPTPPAVTVMPNGTVIGPPLLVIPATGLANGFGMLGMATQGKHRHCGKLSAYLYTGDGPSSSVNFTVILNPGIVGPNVAQVGCTATLGKINDVYYFNYNGEVMFPDGSTVQLAGDDAILDPDGVARKHVNFHISSPQVLQNRAAYFVSLDCPYNTDPQ